MSVVVNSNIELALLTKSINADQRVVSDLQRQIMKRQWGIGLAFKTLMAKHEVSPQNLAETTGTPLPELYAALTVFENHPEGFPHA